MFTLFRPHCDDAGGCGRFMSGGAWNRTRKLQVMSLARYHFSTSLMTC